MNLTRLRKSVFATTAVLMAFSLRANVVLPGQSGVTPDVFSVSGNPPLLGDISGTFNIGNGTLTGKWEEAVLVDPLGITCAGCLDFAFQVSPDQGSGAAIFGMTLARFFGYSTDVGWVDKSGYEPTFVSRGPAGGGVGFDLVRNQSALLPGTASAVMIVATNAKTYDRGGNLSIGAFVFANQSNTTGNIGDLFEPTFIPEPSSALLVMLGAGAIAGLRKRISRLAARPQ